MSLRGTSALPCGPRQSGSGQDFFRPPGPGGDPRPRRLPCPPPAVSLFSDVTPGPRPSPPTFPPHLRLRAPATPQPPTPRRCRAPPAARPGLRPLALSPTCLCYSSSLPCLASDTEAACKTRSAEPLPHLDCEAGSGPNLPRLSGPEGSECARAHFQPGRRLRWGLGVPLIKGGAPRGRDVEEDVCMEGVC